MRASSLLLTVALLASGLAAWAEPPQNVIFITFDGVRYNDVFRAEDRGFLASKGGFPLAHFTEWAIERNGGFRFGSQEAGDQMRVGNSTSWSLPGYKAIFSGLYESDCTDNDCGDSKNETLIDRLYNLFPDKRNVAIFSSWNKIRNATEGLKGHRAAQSIGRKGLLNFKRANARDNGFLSRALKINATSSKSAHLPEWENARKDQYTWAIATDYVKTYHPRFVSISLLDTDEWAHKDNRDEYFKSLSSYDDFLVQLVQQLQSPQHAEYFKNTSIVITTDHGRCYWAWCFQYHGTMFGWQPFETDLVWSYVIPSQFLRQKHQISRSSHGETSGYSQLDIRPTIEALLRIRVKNDQNRGRSLIQFSSDNNSEPKTP